MGGFSRLARMCHDAANAFKANSTSSSKSSDEAFGQPVSDRITASMSGARLVQRPPLVIDRAFFRNTSSEGSLGDIPRSFSQKFTNRLIRFGSKAIASFTALAIAVGPLTYSLGANHAYAQQIIIDPSAPSTSLFSSSNGTPQINIATPESGVSVNKFGNFNVGSDGTDPQ